MDPTIRVGVMLEPTIIHMEIIFPIILHKTLGSKIVIQMPLLV